MDWLDLLTVQGTLKSLRQHHSSKTSVLRRSAFFTVQLSHPYMTTGKTIALTRQTYVGKVMSLLLTMLSRLLTSARAVLLSAEEAETERRMTRDAEMKARSSNNVSPVFIITTTTSLTEAWEGQRDCEYTYQSLM